MDSIERFFDRLANFLVGRPPPIARPRNDDEAPDFYPSYHTHTAGAPFNRRPINPLFPVYAFRVGVISLIFYVLKTMGYISFVAQSIAEGGIEAWRTFASLRDTRLRRMLRWFQYVVEGPWTWAGFFEVVKDWWMWECGLIAFLFVLTRYTPVVSGLINLWETLTKVDPGPPLSVLRVNQQLSNSLNSAARSSGRRRHNAGPPQVPFDPTGDTPFLDEDDGFDSFDDEGGTDDDEGDWQDIRIEELMGPNSPYHGLSLDEIIRRLEIAYGMVKRPLDAGRINQFPLVSISEEQEKASLQCTICLANFEHPEIVKRLDCQHFFHTSCIHRWFEMTATCPLCRFDYGTPLTMNSTIGVGPSGVQVGRGGGGHSYGPRNRN